MFSLSLEPWVNLFSRSPPLMNENATFCWHRAFVLGVVVVTPFVGLIKSQSQPPFEAVFPSSSKIAVGGVCAIATAPQSRAPGSQSNRFVKVIFLFLLL